MRFSVGMFLEKQPYGLSDIIGQTAQSGRLDH